MDAMHVNYGLLSELELMGFSESRSRKALQSSGNSSIEDAINWLIDHENDPDDDDDDDDDQVFEVPVNFDFEASDPSIPEEVKSKPQGLSSVDQDRARLVREEEEKKRERKREKERIRSGKELAMAKRRAEEIEREHFIAQRKKDKEEERRARDRVRQKLLQDKAERKGILGLAPEDPKLAKPETSLVDEKKRPILFVTKSSDSPDDYTARKELMRECLRSIRRQYKEDDLKVKRAFQTLLIYCRNVANNPDEVKFRKIRLGNPAFQARVGFCREGIQFLELCGFERIGEFLFLPREKLDMSALRCAGTVLHSAITNPFFGLLST